MGCWQLAAAGFFLSPSAVRRRCLSSRRSFVRLTDDDSRRVALAARCLRRVQRGARREAGRGAKDTHARVCGACAQPTTHHVARFSRFSTSLTHYLYPLRKALLYRRLASMESHLQSLKVPELKQLLQAASLPVSGNKAELVKRLLENPAAVNDNKGGASGTGEAVAKPSTDAESKSAQASAPAPAPVPAPTAKAASPPAASATTTAPSAKNSAAGAAAKSTASSPPPPAAPTATAPSASRSEVLAELQKRKARAARFGQELSEADRKLEEALTKEGDGDDAAPVSSTSIALLGGELGSQKKNNRRENAAAQKGSNNNKKATATATAPAPALTPEQLAEQEQQRQKQEELKRKRAERFGMVPPPVDAEEEKRRQKRAQKFGGGNGAQK